MSEIDQAPVPPALENAPVNVINQEGELKSLPAAKAQQALSDPNSGYKAATPKDIQNYKDQQEFGTTTQQIITGAEGFAKGLAGPAATAAEVALGVDPERMYKRETINPLTNYGLQGAGLAASNFVPGFGEARDAAAAAETARAALKAGEITKEAAKPILAAAETAINPLSSQSILSGTAARIANKAGLQFGEEGVARAAARGALKLGIESGTLQMGDEVSKLIEGHPADSIETAALDVGAAALLAAPFGGVFGAAHPLWEATTGKPIKEMASDFKSRMRFNLNNPDPATAMSEELTNLHNTRSAFFDDTYGFNGLKSEAIAKLSPKEITSNIIGQSQDALESSRAFLDTMAKNPERYPPHLRANFEEAYNMLNESVSKSESSADIFNSLDKFKRNLQDQSKGWVQDFDPAAKFIKDVKSLGYELRTGLEDSEIWGKAGEAQKELNEAASKYQFVKDSPLKQFQSSFMRKVGPNYEIDPGKVEKYLNATGKPGQVIRQKMLGNFLGATQKYEDAITSVYKKMGEESPFPDAPLSYSKQTLEKQTAGMKLADYVYQKGLSQVAGEAMGAGLGGAAGATVGHPVFGAYLGERALGHFFSSVLPTIVKPLYHGEPSGTGLKAAIDYGTAVARGQRLMEKGAKGLFKAGAEVMPTSMVPGPKEREKLDKVVQKSQLNPSTMLTNGAGALSHYAPDHAAAHGSFQANMINHVTSIKPPTVQAAPLDRKQEPNAIQKAEYNRALDIAQQPLVVLQHIKDGTLVTQDVLNLQKTHPAVYQRMVQEVTNQMIEHLDSEKTIPYPMRMSLSLFLGQPLDSTMTPQAIQAHQMGNKTDLAPSQQGMKPKPSSPALQKMASSFMTAGQQAESRRLK